MKRPEAHIPLQRPQPELTDEDLVSEARQGNREAMEELVRRYQQKAYAIAFLMGPGDPDEAQEVVQEAFLRAFRSLKRFRGQAGFYTWFYRIVVNLCLDSRRRRRRWGKRVFPWSALRKPQDGQEPNPEEHVPDPRAENPMTALSHKQFSAQARKALARLPGKQRAAFELKVFHELRIREIAQILDTAEGTVKSHLFRATQALREALHEWAP